MIPTGWIVTVFENLYGGGSMFDTLSSMDSIFEVIINSSAFVNIILVIQTVGLSMLAIYFFMNLSDEVASKNFNTDQLFKLFLQFFISFGLCYYAMDLVDYLVEIGTSLASELVDSTSVTDFFTETNIARLEKGADKIDLVKGIGYFAKLLIPYLICLVSELSVFFISISRIVEMVVRAIFAPMAVADCYRTGSNSNAVRYLKKFAALALQFAVVVAINIAVGLILTQIGATESALELTEILTEGAKSDYFTKAACQSFLNALTGGTSASGYIRCLGVLVAKIGLLFGSLRICNDIVGV